MSEGGGGRTLEAPRHVDDPHQQPAIFNPARAELAITLSFVLGFLGAVGLGITYWVGGQTQAEGVLLAVALGGIGFGMSAWGKYLMPRGPFAEEKTEHPHEQVEKDREAFAQAFSRGTDVVQRRSFLGKLLGAAAGVFGIVAIFPFIRSLGPQPGDTLFHTTWRRGSRLVGIDGRPVRVDDIDVGGVTTVFPEHDVGSSTAQTILLRVSSAPITTKPGRETWSPHGYLAFSKVCTHAGCPVGLYEEQFQQLLCPCHQSLFDILDGGVPVFGPAPRALPQLPIMADAKGYLVAQSDYQEPIGPGFWERSS